MVVGGFRRVIALAWRSSVVHLRIWRASAVRRRGDLVGWRCTTTRRICKAFSRFVVGRPLGSAVVLPFTVSLGRCSWWAVFAFTRCSLCSMNSCLRRRCTTRDARRTRVRVLRVRLARVPVGRRCGSAVEKRSNFGSRACNACCRVRATLCGMRRRRAHWTWWRLRTVVGVGNTAWRRLRCLMLLRELGSRRCLRIRLIRCVVWHLWRWRQASV